MSSALTLAEANALDQAAFTIALGFVFEHSPWVARRAWTRRPFASLEGLHGAMMDVLQTASADERLSLIRAHPELAGKAAVGRALTARSRSEQASAGLDRLTPPEYERFHMLNNAYRAKFGFPFIICVRLNDKVSILSSMDRRLTAAPEDEVAEAIAQIGLVGRLRLSDAIHD